MKSARKIFPIAFAIVTSLLPAPPNAVAAKPNVVYLLADDLGWGDLSTNGGSIPTPRVDRFFSEGVRLDNFMGWCLCSPTRAMLLTQPKGNPILCLSFSSINPRFSAKKASVYYL